MKLIVEFSVHGHVREHSIDTSASSVRAEEVEPGVYSVLHDGRSYQFIVTDAFDGAIDVHVNGRHYVARVRDPRRLSRKRGGVSLEGAQTIAAPMPGKVVRLLVSVGDAVEAGQGLVVVEAMKMQNEIKSPKAGKVVKIVALEGTPVNAGQALLTVE